MSEDSDDRASEMKSAYEVALERLSERGIRAPREDAVDDRIRRRMEEVRQKAEADLARLQILHRDRLRHLSDPLQAQEEQEDYLRDRRRIEEHRDRELGRLRRAELDSHS